MSCWEDKIFSGIEMNNQCSPLSGLTINTNYKNNHNQKFLSNPTPRHLL